MNRNIKNRYSDTRTRVIRIISCALVLVLSSCSKPKTQEPQLQFTHNKFEDGSVQELGMKKDSLKEGLWITFYPNGKIQSIEFFDDDKWNGPWYHFFENGQLSFYRETKNGGFHGKGYNYHRNGVLAGEMNFIDDKQDGIFKSYDEEGKLVNATEYRNGKYVQTILGIAPLNDDEENE